MQRLSVEEAKARLERGEALFFIDARSDEAWEKATTQIPESLRVPPDRADEFVAAVPPDRTIVTYCT